MPLKTEIYQIYYDSASLKKVLPGFIPLDNTISSSPEWFEFSVILRFLKENDLSDDAWYGFLSPKFFEKTGFDSDFVFQVLENYGNTGNVALFSPGWDQIAYFLNPFEQGEFWHPGLLFSAQEFVDDCHLDIKLNELVADSRISIFSNYVIAKKEFWIKWLELGEKFLKYSESKPSLQHDTSYGASTSGYSMKVFLQERLAILILISDRYQVLCPDQSQTASIFTELFTDDPQTREQLRRCDEMKSYYLETRDRKYLDQYFYARKRVALSSLALEKFNNAKKLISKTN
jgi:hypothetical protein